LFDHNDRADKPGVHSIVVDDATGAKNGFPLSDEIEGRADQGRAAADHAVARRQRQGGRRPRRRAPPSPIRPSRAYFADVASKVVLPMLKARNKPFVLVFWSRDPDGTQHNQGDSLNTVTPGINGPSTMASIRMPTTTWHSCARR